MVEELLKAFALIFASEMGDKTQIIAMTFATKYRVRDVLIGVSIGVFLNHGLAILLGSYLSKVVPMNLIQSIAGLMFVLFGLLALNDEKLEEEDRKTAFSPITTVALAFFIGELGDKTQLTALTLAAGAEHSFVILLGTILGMIATSGLGILVGSKIGEKMPDISVKIISSMVFIFFGTLKLYNWLPIKLLTSNNLRLYFISIIVIHLILTRRLIHKKKHEELSPIKKVANHLYIKSNIMGEKIEEICLGEGICGNCIGDECVIGYTKRILKEARNEEKYFIEEDTDISKLTFKNFDKNKVVEALSLIMADYVENDIIDEDSFIINRIKNFFEFILFGQNIRFDGDLSKYLRYSKRINYDIGKRLEIKIKDNLKLST
ncbi:TMEM165/GDT1 family protein [Tepidimicrobium xylanilyticum]|uniref:GDT1 family protein n=1 Tax=Tepidimicrobium xylanilyticum TaxID=1123352 RepID=A0A1H3A9Y5_9FIRM|nr:TMEM165/GDT1 family protein [Tepidimicrobium xylanilyticum]GMG96277.1 hypothetical protein EN5CB1_11030 [Tepidimicrobium xylanilyticum]SDX26271.1 Putative Ca2+/H+ antiporter, TMEM165/GDT1 family [Tepidimicrobium xylanilyticum]